MILCIMQAHGYVVIPISCTEWDELNGDTKALYVQQKIDMRLKAAAGKGGTQAAVLEGAFSSVMPNKTQLA